VIVERRVAVLIPTNSMPCWTSY